MKQGQIIIDVKMGDFTVEVAGWEYPEELDLENVRHMFGEMLKYAKDGANIGVVADREDL
ncbi:hypothetical protein [Enterococcus casseliflavus]|uniref:hypothetical protein n=1 Tax=Enterococcus casseliflavus TaxID=37734 RepID=UPI00301A6445